MSRGRKPKSKNIKLNWQEFFNKNVGIYLQMIIADLGKSNRHNDESGIELLQKIKEEKVKTNKKQDVLSEISPKEIPFVIPQNWVWCRLGEIIEYAENLNIETKLPKNTLINYVDIDAIDNQNHRIRESKLKPVSELSSRARRVLKKGYIVYSLVRPYLNNIAIVEEEKVNHIGSTGFAVFNGVLVSNTYLKYILLSDYVRELFLSLLSGFNSPTITQEQFNSTPIPLPPISEQNKILEFLFNFKEESIEVDTLYFNRKIENKIFKLHNSQLLSSELYSELADQLTQIENLNQAILQEAVQGKLVKPARSAGGQDKKDEHASELLKRIKAEKAKSGKKEKSLPPIRPEEIPFEIPESWVWCRLGEITDYGSSPKAEPSDLKNDTWVLDLEDIEKTSSNLLCKIRFNERNSLSTKSVFKSGDVLYSKLRPYLDKVIVADEDGVCTTEILPLKCYANLNPYYFKYSLKRIDFLKYVNSVTKGMKMPRLGTKEGQLALIPLPPLSEQKRIVAEIEKQLTKTKQLKEHIIANQEATEQLLKALLHQAFEVNELEEVES